MYPLLYRMLDDQYITGQEDHVETKRGRKRIRVLYSITEAGKTRLVQLIDDYNEYTEGVQQVFDHSVPIGYGEPAGKD